VKVSITHVTYCPHGLFGFQCDLAIAAELFLGLLLGYSYSGFHKLMSNCAFC
jgi:hypothetical protein